MPHQRKRLVSKLLKEKLSYFRVVALQGARQTGKSFLVKNLLGTSFAKFRCLSLDAKTLRDEAQNNPDSFLESYGQHIPLAIDEAQKSPNLFDAIKLKVDSNNRPGQYILLGSTEFSKQLKIRESLTGRLGRIRMFPLCYHEVLGLEKKLTVSRAQTLKYFERGGLPGILFARNDQARYELFKDWLALICERDIHQFKSLKLDSDLTGEIFRLCAVLEEPTAANIAKKMRVSGIIVKKHLDVLVQLFALEKINPHPSTNAKIMYYPLDVGLANFLGADAHRRVLITLINELNCYWHYHKKITPHFYYYRSLAKNRIDLIVGENPDKCTAYQIFTQEHIGRTELLILTAFKEKNPQAKTRIFAPVLHEINIDHFKIESWEKIFNSY
jgi:predicted AAA+ superfamily ATPase